MQTKSSYPVLKWTFIFGAMASLGTACVVTGDGTSDPFGDGGESGSSNAEAGKTSTAGSGGTTSTAGKPSGGSAGTATTPVGGAGGDAGEVYIAGLCDADEPDAMKFIVPTMFPSCAPAANDVGQDCKICLKDKCCDAWQNCYGSEPQVACGWGPKEDDLGQWDCLQNCFVDNTSGSTDPDELLIECSAQCTNQCEADDGGNLNVVTSDLIACANNAARCQEDCFPF